MTPRKFLLCFILATLTVGIQAELLKKINAPLIMLFAKEDMEEDTTSTRKHQKLPELNPGETDEADELIKSGVMNSDGSFKMDALYAEAAKSFPDNPEARRVAENLFRKCGVKKHTPGESARKFLVCLKLKTLKHGECISEIGLKPGKKLENRSEHLESMKQFLFCVLKKFRVMDDRGAFIMGPLKKQIQKEAFTKEQKTQILEKCAKNKGSGGETAYNFVMCSSAVLGIEKK